jgi:hypothetical protein
MSMLRYTSFLSEILSDRCAAVRVDHDATRVLPPGVPALRLTTPSGFVPIPFGLFGKICVTRIARRMEELTAI